MAVVIDARTQCSMQSELNPSAGSGRGDRSMPARWHGWEVDCEDRWVTVPAAFLGSETITL